MKQFKEFDIQFVGLKDGFHQFNYHIDKTFFDAYNFDEYEDASLKVTVEMNKKVNLMEFKFAVKGFVTVPCDVTGELFNLDIEGDFPLIVKFGDEYNDENEEILILSHEMYKLNVSQYIYELIVLSVPLKRLSPDVKDDEQIEQIEYKNEEVDPRWDKLKDLLTGKNE